MSKLKTLVIFGIAIYFTSCQSATTVDYVLFSGKVNQAGNISYVTIKGDNYSYDVDMNSDGSFLDTLRLSKGYYTFYSGRERTQIFLEPGYALDLSFDQPQFDETLSFQGEGKGSKLNNYLADKVRLDENLTSDFQTLFSQEAEEFIGTVAAWKAKMEELLAQAAIEDQQFIAMEERNISYEYLTQFANYEYYHQFATKDWSYQAPESIGNFLTGIDLNNEADFGLLRNYKQLLQSYFGAMIERGEVEQAFEAIRSIESSIIKEGLVPNYTYNVEPGNEHAEAIYQGIISITSDSATVAKLTSKIEKIRKLQTGMPSASFAYQSIEGNTIALEEFKGRYVYIDVWATWCGPCIREIPALKQLEQDYHQAPVEFVSISIDALGDFEKWQQMVADKNLKGIQLFADNSWQSDFVKAYAIDGIPRFIVIDPEGNIVDPNAPRPSDPEIRAMFENFVNKS